MKWRPSPGSSPECLVAFGIYCGRLLSDKAGACNLTLPQSAHPTGHLPPQKGSCKQTLPAFVALVRWFPLASRNMFCFGLNYGTLLKLVDSLEIEPSPGEGPPSALIVGKPFRTRDSNGGRGDVLPIPSCSKRRLKSVLTTVPHPLF